MNLREKPRLNYRTIHEGPSLPSNNPPKETWSTSKLWDLEIVDERVTESGVVEVNVHYLDYPDKYNEWRVLHEIVDRPRGQTSRT